MSVSNKLVRMYAKSLLRNAAPLANFQENFSFPHLTVPKNLLVNIYIIGEELLFLRAVILNSLKIKDIIANPTLLEKQKIDVLLNIFPGISLSTRSFLKVLSEKGHLFLLPQICEEYNEMLQKQHGRFTVKLIVASPLEEYLGPSLFESLKFTTGSNKVSLNLTYSPKLLAGLVIEYDSTIIDLSALREFSLFASFI